MRTTVATLKGKTIAFAASGGLDSCTVTRWLTEAGVNVVCVTADMLEPTFEVYAPWRDEAFLAKFRGRSEMIDYCTERKLPIKATKDAPYSTDANLLGLTHEAGKLESLQTPPSFVTPGMGVHASAAPNEPETVTVRFEKGRPVAINGEKVDAYGAIILANRLGGRHGVGIATH